MIDPDVRLYYAEVAAIIEDFLGGDGLARVRRVMARVNERPIETQYVVTHDVPAHTALLIVDGYDDGENWIAELHPYHVGESTPEWAARVEHFDAILKTSYPDPAELLWAGEYDDADQLK